ncbi:MAG: hypothetical protein BroJett038_26450 [Chloroflexota bacterium]|nr:MAG: hypothetical protein BroJett038_26450 [Chloroflexota bacterium]
MRERKPVLDLDREIIGYFANTFMPRFDRYPLQRRDGSYVAVNDLLTFDRIANHLLGWHTLGAYALDTDSQARWLCLDADDQPTWRGLISLARALAADFVPAYLELSRRGGHLWLFTAPTPGREIRRFGKQLLHEHGLEQVELYPKQDELRTGPGSLVRLPLGFHRKDNRRYHFVTLDSTTPLAPTIRDQVRLLTNPGRVPPAFMTDVLARAPERQPVFPTLAFKTRVRKGKPAGETPSERIKNAVSVLDFVGQYVDLDAGGRGYCPFHDDHRMSFGVQVDGNFWHCFAGCGGGSVIDFYMKWRALNGQDGSFTATIKDLIGLLGL